ncbi:MAG TPA: hypothetical protein VKT70_11190, partial [Stellaceae bacterium]|nr:hypothetical protein [Stellaceae bacterium]
YDPRAYKLATFAIGGAIAGLAGCLFANWGQFVSPTIFGLAQSAQIIIWVIVGGRGTLIGPIIGCLAIQWLTETLGAFQLGGLDRPVTALFGPETAAWLTPTLTATISNAPLILGAVLIAFVLLVPKGIVPTLAGWGRRVVGAAE